MPASTKAGVDERILCHNVMASPLASWHLKKLDASNTPKNDNIGFLPG